MQKMQKSVNSLFPSIFILNPSCEFEYITPGPSKLEKVVDPGSGPRGPLPKFCRILTKFR
jgi:hypothetical protein